MQKEWDEDFVIERLLEERETLVCDALLDQQLFAESRNIIKYEVLFGMKLHREVKVRALHRDELRVLMRKTHHYALQFYDWEKVPTQKKL